MLNALELTGQARTHVVQNDALGFALHPMATEAFLDLAAEGGRLGFDLRAASSFRDFPAQLAIWNRKVRGERPVLDAAGREVDRSVLSPWQLLEAILGWSALPGASRHHWGSDLDVFDAKRTKREDVRLLPAEFAAGGPFYDLSCWLDEALGRFGFFRPYDIYRGGVQPEPWHLSFAAVSTPALTALTPELLRHALAGQALEGVDLVDKHLLEIHAKYVCNVAEADRGLSNYV